MTTAFETDKRNIHTDSVEIMKRRKKELADLAKRGKATKNAFKRQCLAQEYARLKSEYDALDTLI